jgi:putative FmdB family regulatory protein
MPIYEYECGDCGTRTEAIQRFADEPLTVCSSCGGPLTKLMSAPAFQFKGTGWYVTDYADKNKKSGAEAKSRDSGKESSGGEDSKGETGSAAKEPSTSASSTSSSETSSASGSSGGASSSDSS